MSFECEWDELSRCISVDTGGFGLMLSDEIGATLREIADRRSRGVHEVMAEALREYCEQWRRKVVGRRNRELGSIVSYMRRNGVSPRDVSDCIACGSVADDRFMRKVLSRMARAGVTEHEVRERFAEAFASRFARSRSVAV